MNIPVERPLASQRADLRSAIHAQRRRIALLIDPPEPLIREYPRSATMRFLTAQPAIVAGIAAKYAPVLFGPRLVRSALMAIALGRVVRSLLRGR